MDTRKKTAYVSTVYVCYEDSRTGPRNDKHVNCDWWMKRQKELSTHIPFHPPSGARLSC